MRRADAATEPSKPQADKAARRRGPGVSKLSIDRTVELTVEAPAGSRHKGYEEIIVQDNRATLTSALGAGEPAPARKVHIQIEPTILDRKLATRHRPRRLQPKGQLEKIGVSHPLTINSIPTDRSPSEPKKRPYPLHSARSLRGSRTAIGFLAKASSVSTPWQKHDKTREPVDCSCPRG